MNCGRPWLLLNRTNTILWFSVLQTSRFIKSSFYCWSKAILLASKNKYFITEGKHQYLNFSLATAGRKTSHTKPHHMVSNLGHCWYLGFTEEWTQTRRQRFVQWKLSLMKVIQANTTKGKMACVHELEDLIFKYPCYPKLSTDSMQSLSESQWHFHREKRKGMLQFLWNHKKLWIVKTILSKNKTRYSMLLDF